MPSKRSTLGVVGLTLVAVAPASAQVPDWCALEGERVRVHAAGAITLQGVSLGCTDGILLIQTDGAADRPHPYVYRSVAVDEVLGIDVGRGTRRPVVRAVLIGTTIMASLFGGFQYLTGSDGSACATGFCVRVSRTRKTVAGLTVGAVLGAGGGLLYGLNREFDIWEPWPQVPLHPGDRWTVLPAVETSGAVGLHVFVRP